MASKFLTPWDPFGIARSLRNEVDRLVESALIRPAGWLANWEPGKGILPLDVYAEGDNLIVKAAMPGLKPAEVKVEVDGDTLTIVGESKQEQENKERSHHLRDHFSVRLERSVLLSALVDANKAEAVFADGVLTVTLPRAEHTAIGQIAIEPAGKVQVPEPEPEPVAAQTTAAQAPEPEPAVAEPVAVQTAKPEPAVAEPVAVQTAEPEPVVTEPVAAQKAEPEAAAAQTVAAQAAESAPASAETVAVQAAEPVAAQTVEPETVTAQKAEPEPAAAQAAKAQKVERHKAKRQKHEAEKVA